MNSANGYLARRWRRWDLLRGRPKHDEVGWIVAPYSLRFWRRRRNRVPEYNRISRDAAMEKYDPALWWASAGSTPRRRR